MEPLELGKSEDNQDDYVVDSVTTNNKHGSKEEVEREAEALTGLCRGVKVSIPTDYT